MQINATRCILRKNNFNFVQTYAKSSKIPKALLSPWGKPEDLFQAGNSAHTEGNLELAENFYKKAIKIDPNFHKAYFNLAIVHHENGETNTAKTRMQKVLKDKNLDVETTSLFAKGLAKIHQEQGNLRLAIKYYKIALVGSPNDKDMLDNLGNSYASLGKLNEALESFQKAVEVDPTEVKTQMKVALTLQDFKKMKEAMGIFEEILKSSPNNIEALLGMGVSYTYLFGEEEQGNDVALNKIKDSIYKYFNRAYVLEPQNAQVLLNFGIFYIEQGSNKELGNQYLAQALQLAPKDLDLLYSIGFLKFKMGQNSEALSLFERVLALDPKHTDSMVHIGLIYQEKGDIKKAIKYYQSAVDADPHNSQNRNLLGMVLQESGNLADALDQFLLALKDDRKDWSIHMNLATIYRQLNEIEKSDQHRAYCIKLNKESIKMFELADAENTDTDASVDSLSWTQNNGLNAPAEDDEYEDEYEVTSSDDDSSDSTSSDFSSDSSSDYSDTNHE
jgi:tetratricopeptide (TPR) repeat protein